MYFCPELLLEIQNPVRGYPYVPLNTSENDLIIEDPSQPDRGRKRPPLQDSHGPAGLRMKGEDSWKYFDCGETTAPWKEDTGKGWDSAMYQSLGDTFLSQCRRL